MRYTPVTIGGKLVRGKLELPDSGTAPLFIDDEGDVTAGTQFDNLIYFENVDAVEIPYGSTGRKPVLHVFVRDEFGTFNEAFPRIDYNLNTNTVLVSFGSEFESGKVVIN